MGITTAVFSKPALFTVAASLAVGLSACGSSAESPGSAAPGNAPQTSSSPTFSPSLTSAATKPAAAAPVVTIKNFEYTVAKFVAPGAEVVSVNNDSEAHTITSAKKGAFDVKVDPAGATATFKAPAKPGTYPFVCQFHAGMKGTLVVR
jgi:plastocyanin